MYRYALSRVGDTETAQDLVQEALVAAIKAFERFQGRSSIKTWLVAILKRKIVDHYRQKSNRQTTDDIETIEWISCLTIPDIGKSNPMNGR
jgi:RNA polymerase sigma-70 factor (ECF subfamily)